MKSNQEDIGVFYYWENFEYVLAYLSKFYTELLTENEISWITQYHKLPKSAQCLYLRLLNRKDQWFLTENILYPEIPDIPLQLEILRKNGFLIDWNKDVYFFYFPWESLNKYALRDLFHWVNPTEKLPINLSVPEIRTKIQEISSEDFARYFKAQEWTFVTPLEKKFYLFFQFLFFGTRAKNLSEFVVRDLGYRQYFEVKEEDWKPYFTNREDIDHKWFLSDWALWLFNHQEQIVDEIELFSKWQDELLVIQNNLSDFTYGSFERIGLQLGRLFEKRKQLDLALSVYQHLLSSEAFERRVRIYHKRKELEDAIYLAEVGLALAVSPKSTHFFQDYLLKNKDKKQIKKVTFKLKYAEIIEIDKKFEGRVEEGMVEYYQENGFRAFFVENRLWKSLMGLWGWDLIFDPSNKGFHHPFQLGPSHFRSELFSIEIQAPLTDLLKTTRSKNELLKLIRENAQKHFGNLNPLVDWQLLDLDLIEKFILSSKLSSIKQIISIFWENLSAYSKGFPDLVVFSFDWKKVFFVEVKSPNDHLSAVQYFWNEELNRAGIEAKIIRVKWR